MNKFALLSLSALTVAILGGCRHNKSDAENNNSIEDDVEVVEVVEVVDEGSTPWWKSHFIDEFGDDTGEAYFCCVCKGDYKTSDTTGKIEVRLIVSEDDFRFDAYRNGEYRITGEESWVFKAKLPNDSIATILTLNDNAGCNSINPRSAETVWKLFSTYDTIKFVAYPLEDNLNYIKSYRFVYNGNPETFQQYYSDIIEENSKN